MDTSLCNQSVLHFLSGELYCGYGGECPYSWGMHAEVFGGEMAFCLQLFLKWFSKKENVYM